MSRVLVVAAGGGGDAITASALVAASPEDDGVAVMSYSWDRLMIDPTPGPRTRHDFTGLTELASGVMRVRPASRLTTPGISTLVQLAEDLPLPLLLLDPVDGAIGIGEQVHAAAEYFDCDSLMLVDVGGDALARGDEPGLRSPIADFLALAACARTGLPLQLFVTGLGLDGELATSEMNNRLGELSGTEVAKLDGAAVADVLHLFEWHPSEANGLLAAAASGTRGVVETRDGSGTTMLTSASTRVYRVDAAKAIASSPASRLFDTTSLDDVEDAIRELRGTSEIDYERDKAGRLATGNAEAPTVESLRAIDDYVSEAANRGIDYLTIRRAAELVNAMNTSALQQLRQLLRAERSGQYVPPLYRTGSE
ncbi:DUF1152 domain-containing protein [Haloechinothrix sp. YIM 98757]|uniref:DUF1152 domain-containing protein n=1 Tax=Haloechinothrix aidingensis TaxID=2752311 RepID=A0A838A680_9PSEU|nr:DUF1152 domain-containing protein [Haloechinothrix aidingensis]MBA0124335.1 DUF1152 domain-containing protein [Haloechinothrix aidingensis]